jgi:methionyl-tRNA formyltransferase
MWVVFMGTPAFAVPSLSALASVHEVVAVYARPDAPAGRGRQLVALPVKEAASALGIPVHQPESLRDGSVAEELRALAPDVLAVAAFGAILPPAVLATPRLAPLNVHASLLPRWRGAAPVQRAILAGDEVTGVSIMRMEEGLDTGPWCVQRTVEVDDHTTASLTAELAEVGADALLDALSLLNDGRCEWHDQDEADATYAEKVGREDVALAPAQTVVQAYRRIRASTRQAAARACVAGTDLTVAAASLSGQRLEPGRVHASREGLLLGFADGVLVLDIVIPAGRGMMDGASFARGARIAASARWGACR